MLHRTTQSWSCWPILPQSQQGKITLCQSETKHPFFFHKNCTSRSTLEMSKNKQLTFAYYCILICGNCPVENTGNGISETLNLKIFWGSMPPDPTRLCHLCHYNFSSMHVCVFKISCYMYAPVMGHGDTQEEAVKDAMTLIWGDSSKEQEKLTWSWTSPRSISNKQKWASWPDPGKVNTF